MSRHDTGTKAFLLKGGMGNPESILSFKNSTGSCPAVDAGSGLYLCAGERRRKDLS